MALVCYTTLALCVPLLTPVVETLAKHLTIDVWVMAREEPPPRRATLYPFRPDLFLGRYELGQGEVEVETGDAVIPQLKDPEPLEKVLEEKVLEENEREIGVGKGEGTRDEINSWAKGLEGPVVEEGKGPS